MKKIIGLYLIYMLCTWVYFSFFYPLESFSEIRYGAYAHAMYFTTLPLPWILLYSLVKTDLSIRMAEVVRARTKWEWLRTALFCGLLAGLYGLVQLPFDFSWYAISLWAGTSHQVIADWFYEWSVSLLLFWFVLSAGVHATRLLMGKVKKMWWFILWLAALPVVFFIVYIQPIWIDPLFEDFAEVEAGPMRHAIENFTARAGLEDATLLKVNMSEETGMYNAYVTGILGSERIILWDTTLENMEKEEVLFILAHEIGHYVYHHVFIGVAGYIVMSFVLLWMVSVVYRKAWSGWLAKKNGWTKENELKAIPILLLTASLLLAMFQPVSMAVSREIEKAADGYAIEHTEDLDVAIDSFTRMAEQSKTDIHPVYWVKWLRYSHPPIMERINRIEAVIDSRSP